ncbi:MAG: gamma carbonic anhydrase family protein [Acidimicrobiales bacterium]
MLVTVKVPPVPASEVGLPPWAVMEDGYAQEGVVVAGGSVVRTPVVDVVDDAPAPPRGLVVLDDEPAAAVVEVEVPADDAEPDADPEAVATVIAEEPAWWFACFEAEGVALPHAASRIPAAVNTTGHARTRLEPDTASHALPMAPLRAESNASAGATGRLARGRECRALPRVPCTAMAIYALGDLVPTIDPTAFVHPLATVIGDVTIGAESSVWPSAVVRGDYGRVTIGSRTSVQDGSVVHAGPGFPTAIGDGCVIGHIVHLEGCTLEDECLIGSGAVVLHYVRVGRGALVGAGAVVPNGVDIPPGAMAVGVPVTIKPDASHVELIRIAAEEYVKNCRRYREELRRLD